MTKEYDYAPTFLGGIGSILQHLHSDYLLAKSSYKECLEELRAMEDIKKDEILVKSWSEDLFSLSDPRDKAELYKQISEYIKTNSSEDWVFSRLEEEEETEYDHYDDYPTEVVVFNLYAYIKTEDSLKNTDVYKQQVKRVEFNLKRLKEAEEDFLKEARKQSK